jgi:type I restriction-modification system DNA methylase subunit
VGNVPLLHDICKKYLGDIAKVYLSGKATEPSYYPVLKTFLESYTLFRKMDAEIIAQPKQIESSMPDFLLRTSGMMIGSIEAKDIPTNLADLEKSKQLLKYRKTYHNLLFTDFFTFVLYRDGRKIATAKIADKNVLLLSAKVPKTENEQNLRSLLDSFLEYFTPQSYTAKQLATELAKRSKQLREYIAVELSTNNFMLLQIYENIKKQLLPALTKDRFADIYAQTLAYGLFFAKVEAREKQFNRINAYSYLPENIPLLRRLFYIMQDPTLIDSLKWIIEDIVTLLNIANMESIMKSFHNQLWSEDAVVHFYETFLAVYNPKERERRGVYYTPGPVVAYIVSSIQEFLRGVFAKADGLADSTVTLLDPAAGTLTFPTMAIKLCHDEFVKKGKAGVFPNLVREHILKDYFAFELLLAPYVIGHFKVTLSFEDLGYELGDSRFQLYLTNALESTLPAGQQFLFPELENEAEKASKIKSDPIFVIMGNPPYSVSSENKSEFIEQLMEDYKRDVKEERNIQPLSDDYIKFLRFAHWKIAEKTGKGIVGMITNNAYVDGLIHRGMRKKIYEAFDQIYILNLHGNSRSHEKTPDGGKDENVFDIQQGVAIIFLIKNGGENKLFYSDLWGLRNAKYAWLLSHNALNTDWAKLNPEHPNYWFFPKKEIEKYNEFPLLSELMPFHRQGVKTHRDWLVVGFAEDEIVARMKALRTMSEDEMISAIGLKESQRPSVTHAKQLASGLSKISEDKIIKYCYRPFDYRYLYYDSHVLDRPRLDLAKQKGSIFLVTRRNSRQWPGAWSFAHVTKKLPDIDMRGGTYAFPLIVDGSPNFSRNFLNWVSKLLGEEALDPEGFLGYIYAILYSKEYRKKYDPELRMEFPRIPLTSSKDLFLTISAFGTELMRAHLLCGPEIESMQAGFPETGSDLVEEANFDPESFRVIINEKQWFSNVPLEVWKYEVGGYQICERWLLERLGRKLNSNDQIAYMKIVGAIKRTITIQKQIDNLYAELESTTIKLPSQEAQQALIHDS